MGEIGKPEILSDVVAGGVVEVLMWYGGGGWSGVREVIGS